MNVTIIIAHPWQESFNWSVYRTVLEALEASGKTCTTIDLNKDNFDPVMKEEDLALYPKGETTDPLIKKYQEILIASDELVFIFPIWWFGIPAILKGFFDKVLLKGFAFEIAENGFKGLLMNIRKTTILTTSGSATSLIEQVKGDPINNTVIKGTLNPVGINNVKWFNNEKTTSGTRESRLEHLAKLYKYFSL